MGTVYKLVFAGPVGAGKTTAIRSLSDINVVDTEAQASDAVGLMKDRTTVAMDYGLMKLDGDMRVHLYGTPGQKRFDFMWDILTEGSVGLVMMLNAKAADPVADLRTYLAGFESFIRRTAMVVGITHASEGGWEMRQRVCQALVEMGYPPIAMDVDARNRKQVACLVRALIYSMDPDLEPADALTT